ncbi:MAG: hypothetical protein J7M03_04870 [Candidatus Desulfofervidaceae bacterium]|nr:hypothetical protein [Candidatus Desulfofervidaceae bacterium]MDL1970015.1 hypothetical protein [Candidatus Desulfofervidaceae bacterium]
MMISTNNYLEKVLKVYESQFKTSKKGQKGQVSRTQKRGDEIVLSIEGKKKQIFEEIMLEALSELSNDTFENGK